MLNQITLRSIVIVIAMVFLAIGLIGLAGGLFTVVFAGIKAGVVVFVYGAIFSALGCMFFAGLEA